MLSVVRYTDTMSIVIMLGVVIFTVQYSRFTDIMMSVILNHGEFLYATCSYTDWPYAECHNDHFPYAEARYAEVYNAYWAKYYKHLGP